MKSAILKLFFLILFSIVLITLSIPLFTEWYYFWPYMLIARGVLATFAVKLVFYAIKKKQLQFKTMFWIFFVVSLISSVWCCIPIDSNTPMTEILLLVAQVLGFSVAISFYASWCIKEIITYKTELSN